MDKLCKRRDEINKDRKPFPISFAYGYCLSDDNELSEFDEAADIVEKVYRMADKRMYKYKIEMKAARDV
ncbi:MAG: hypothetical protein IKQ71_10590 [Lachnospiraceae bacterium]|nr:hypothetical protein [Lachnospiraceae bacterium]